MQHFIYAFCAILFTVSVSAQIPTDSLVGHWKFDNNFDDAGTYANHGTPINGIGFTTDQTGAPNAALQCSWANQHYVEVPDSPSLHANDELTIAFWAKRGPLGGQDGVINKGGDWISGTCNYGLVFSENTLVFIHNLGYHGLAVPGIPANLLIPYNGPYGTALPGAPMDTEWHHYAITTKNGEDLVSFYLDGVLAPTFYDGTSQTVNLNPVSNAPVTIGGTWYYSNNAMDEMRLYRKKLTEQEIKAVYCEFGFTASSITVSACGSYEAPDGVVYTDSGIKTAIIPNMAGCDSLITIDLTIVNLINTISSETNLLTADQPDAQYQWLDCDNGLAPVDGAMDQVFIPSQSGNYAVEVQSQGCTVTSDCVAFIFESVSDLNPKHRISVFPNPASDFFRVKWDATQEVEYVGIYFSDGRLFELRNVRGCASVEFRPTTSGLYFVVLTTASQEVHKIPVVID